MHPMNIDSSTNNNNGFVVPASIYNPGNQRGGPPEVKQRRDSNHSDDSVSAGDKINDEHSEMEALFEGSTHYYLIYVVDEDGNRSINLAILGLLVVVIQSALYGILINTGFGDDYLAHDKVPVEINIADCWGSELFASLNSTYWQIKDHAQCDIDNYRSYLEGIDHCNGGNPYLILAMILVAFFLQYDFLASISVILNVKSKWSKVAGLLVLIEALLAMFCCSIFAYQGVLTGSGYDAIMNTIGVLFVHDVDEKLFEAVGIIHTKQLFRSCKCFHCNGKCGFWTRNSKLWITLIVILCVVLIGAVLLPIRFDQVPFDVAVDAFEASDIGKLAAMDGDSDTDS